MYWSEQSVCDAGRGPNFDQKVLHFFTPMTNPNLREFLSIIIVPHNFEIHDLNVNLKWFLPGMVLVGQFKRYTPWGSQKFTGDH